MEIISGEWGKAKTFLLPFIEYGATDFKTGVTLAAGDVKISKDGGAFTNIATLPTILGAWMVITLSATEMQAEYIAFQAIDQTATKVFEDQGAILATTPRAWIQGLFTLIESQRGSHTGVHDMFFFDPIGGLDTNSGLFYHDAKKTYNFEGPNGIHSLLNANEHQIVFLLPNASGGPTTISEYIEVDKAYTFLRGPGRDWLIEADHNESCAVKSSAEGVEFSGFRVKTKDTGSQDGVCAGGDFTKIRKVHVDFSRGSGMVIDNASSCIFEEILVQDAAAGGSGHALHILGDRSLTTRNIIYSGRIIENNGDGIRVDGANCRHNFINGSNPDGLVVHANSGWGINEVNDADHTIVIGPRIHLGHNTLGRHNLTGANSIIENEGQWAEPGADGDTLKDISDEIAAIPSVTVVGSGTFVERSGVTDGGAFDFHRGDDKDFPFTINGDMTAHTLYFYMKDSKSDAAFAIEDKLLSGWSVADGLTTGTIDFVNSETKDLALKQYDCEIKAKNGAGDVFTVWEAKMSLKNTVAKKTDIP